MATRVSDKLDVIKKECFLKIMQEVKERKAEL